MSDQELIERLEAHVRNRGGPTIENGAWQMMLDAAARIQALSEEVVKQRGDYRELSATIWDLNGRIIDRLAERDAALSQVAEMRAAMQGVYDALGAQHATGTIGSISWYRNHWSPAWEKFVAALHSSPAQEKQS